MDKRKLVVTPSGQFPAEIAGWIWALEDARARTKRAVQDVAQDVLDWHGAGNSIGSLLYHIAAVELDWLFVDVLGQEFPPEAYPWFPQEVRDESERLVAVVGESLSRHLERLDYVRNLLIQTYLQMDAQDFRRPRIYDDREVSPQWVLYHLTRHEAAHQGQILLIKRLALVS